MKKKIIYICSPYRGNIPLHVAQAKTMCRFALKKGTIPLAPHLYFPQFMNEEDSTERELALFMGRVLQGKCAELWAFGDVITEGMRGEIETAKRRRQPVRYFNTDFEEVDAL